MLWSPTAQLARIIKDGHPLWVVCVRMIMLGLYEKMKEMMMSVMTDAPRSVLPPMNAILRLKDSLVCSPEPQNCQEMSRQILKISVQHR